MATFHCHIKPISRKSGRSAVASAAYRSGTRLTDRAQDVAHDYTARQHDVLHKEILLPGTAERHQELAWAQDREELWNQAEAAEERPDARVAREYELSLPHELTDEQRLTLARQFSQDVADRYGVAADLAIHRPGKTSDDRNHHAHIMTTTRQVTPTGLGRKTDIELSHEDRKAKGLDSARNEIRDWRKQWEWRANTALKDHGHAAQIDSRSLKDQGIDREPKRYRGRQVTEDRVRKARAQQAEKTRRSEPAREPPRPMTEAERDALIQARWLQRHEERKKTQESAPSVEERYLARREERLRDPEGYRRREQEKELAQVRDRSRGRDD